MSSSCLRRAAVPVKRVWLGLRTRLGRRRSGLGELRREVRTCEYDDVHVMWEMLSGMDGSAPRKYVYLPVPNSGALAAAASNGKKRRRRRRADAKSAASSLPVARFERKSESELLPRLVAGFPKIF